MATSNLSTLERLYSLRELYEMGYGHRHTITKLIREGRVPAVKMANGYKIRERDLRFLRDPKSKDSGSSDTFTREPSLGDYVKALVDTFPKLDANEKAELGRLLSPAA